MKVGANWVASHMVSMKPRDWYARNYPETAPDLVGTDDRCWTVLGALGQIYNLVNRNLPDGGLRRAGNGLAMVINTEVATYDGSEMTKLVIAAHQHCCRVAVRPVILVATTAYYGGIHQRDGVHREVHSLIDDLANEWGDVYLPGEDVEEALFGTCHECGLPIHRDTEPSPWVHDDDPDDDHEIDPVLPTVELHQAVLEVLIMPRDPESDHPFERHPSVKNLVAAAGAQQ